jgi:hypothetical protein
VIFALSSKDQNSALLDPWSLVHLASGLALGLIGVGLPVVASLGVAYEVAEFAAETSQPSVRRFFRISGPENLGNQVVDVALLVAGAKLGHLWRQT